MEKEELLERYETLGEEADFLAAKPLYEQALPEGPNERLLNEYGYLLECHGRRELRRAVDLYERAIALDPSYDKPHYQLISARAAVQEPELPVAIYEQRLANSPGELREHRFLANAYLKTHAYERASAVVEAGLALAPEDAPLVALRGEAKAGLGDSEGALADWRRALELEPEDIGALYSSAFLLERDGRLAEAAEGVALDHRVERVARVHAAERVAEAGTRAVADEVNRDVDERWREVAARIRAAQGWSLRRVARLGREREDRCTWLADGDSGEVVVKLSANPFAPERARWAVGALSLLHARGVPG